MPADGAYTVTPYYPGSYVFKDMSNAEGQIDVYKRQVSTFEGMNDLQDIFLPTAGGREK